MGNRSQERLSHWMTGEYTTYCCS